MKYIILIILFSPLFSFAQSPTTEEFYELGRQGVEIYLRGYLFKSRKEIESCWKNDQIPNVYLQQHEFVSGDNAQLLKKILKKRSEDLLKIEDYKVIPTGLKLKSEKAKFNYNNDGTFMYEFIVQQGSKFVGCKKTVASDIAGCAKPILLKDKSSAFKFELLFTVMSPKDSEEKNKLNAIGKPAWLIMVGKPEPTHFKLLKSACEYR